MIEHAGSIDLFFVTLFLGYFFVRETITSVLTNGWRTRLVVGKATGGDVLFCLWIVLGCLVILAGLSAPFEGPSIFTVASFSLLSAGSALRVWALYAIRHWYAPDIRVYQGQTIVRTGPYKWLRQPLYLGLCIEAIGLGLLWGHWAGWLLVAAVVVLTQIQNRRERIVLTAVLSEDYRQHFRSTWDIEDLWIIENKGTEG